MTDSSSYKLFVPVTLFSEEVVDFLDDSGQIELMFALPNEDERVFGRPDAEEIIPQIDAAIDAALPDIHVLFGITANNQLTVTRAMMERAPNLLVVFVVGVGTDGIDVEAATELGIAVINAPGSNYQSVSEHTVALMLSLTRKIVQGAVIASRERRNATMAELGSFPYLLRGKTLGLVGFGFIGREVARICRDGFGMQVQVYDPFFHPVEASRLGVTLVDDLHDVLRAADVVSVHSPLTPQTRHIIGSEELREMKDSAILINASRGGTVDTEALVAALEAGEIAAAGLDVTEPEPLPAGHRLFELDNVVLSPHSAGAAPNQVVRGALTSSTGVVRALRGERPWNLVNPDGWTAYLERLRAQNGATVGS